VRGFNHPSSSTRKVKGRVEYNVTPLLVFQPSYGMKNVYIKIPIFIEL
jgi:hypothetical protein